MVDRGQVFDDPALSLHAFSAPHAGNANLHAQRGFFTLWGHTLAEFDETHVVPPLDECAKTLLRFDLSLGEAPKLLYLLAREGIHGASLFPGYGGVARLLQEIRRWPVEFQPDDLRAVASFNAFPEGAEDALAAIERGEPDDEDTA